MVARETLVVEGLRAAGLPDPAGDPAIVASLVRYADILEDVALARGFIGPAEGPRIIDRHIIESAALAGVAGNPATIVDVGSGAGLPGIVLAILTGSPTHLIDADQKRAAFLTDTAATLGLDVTVWTERAEDAARHPDLRDFFELATARALAKPPVALEYTLPFVAPGGRAILSVGPSIHDELGSLDAVTSALAAGPPELVPLQVPGATGRAWAMIIEKHDVCPAKFPRRTGVAARRPLSGRVGTE